MIVVRKENSMRVEMDDINIQVERTDPYGFWKITGKQGKTKLDFDGEYTSLGDAKTAIIKVISNLVEVDEKELKALA